MSASAITGRGPCRRSGSSERASGRERRRERALIPSRTRETSAAVLTVSSQPVSKTMTVSGLRHLSEIKKPLEKPRVRHGQADVGTKGDAIVALRAHHLQQKVGRRCLFRGGAAEVDLVAEPAQPREVSVDPLADRRAKVLPVFGRQVGEVQDRRLQADQKNDHLCHAAGPPQLALFGEIAQQRQPDDRGRAGGSYRLLPRSETGERIWLPPAEPAAGADGVGDVGGRDLCEQPAADDDGRVPADIADAADVQRQAAPQPRRRRAAAAPTQSRTTTAHSCRFAARPAPAASATIPTTVATPSSSDPRNNGSLMSRPWNENAIIEHEPPSWQSGQDAGKRLSIRLWVDPHARLWIGSNRSRRFLGGIELSSHARCKRLKLLRKQKHSPRKRLA